MSRTRYSTCSSDSELGVRWAERDKSSGINIVYLIRDIKPPKKAILFPPIFSQFEQLKKKTNFLLVQNRGFDRVCYWWSWITKACIAWFWPVLDHWKVCFLFQLLKIGGNKIGGLISRTRYCSIHLSSSYFLP